jgi:hypothetical protein
LVRNFVRFLIFYIWNFLRLHLFLLRDFLWLFFFVRNLLDNWPYRRSNNRFLNFVLYPDLFLSFLYRWSYLNDLLNCFRSLFYLD